VVKTILAPTVLAVLGLTVAGCGSGKKANTGGYTVTLHHNVPSGPITVTGAETTAISNVKTGTRISCKTRHGQGANVKVPRVGATVSEGQLPLTTLGQSKPPEQQINVTHLEDGSITVSCTQSK
jgi:hypothetical protein